MILKLNKLRSFFLFSVFCIATGSLLAEDKKPNLLDQITIISADRLESTKQISILIGNIDIEFRNYRIKAPYGRILANFDGDFDLASFTNGVILQSQDLRVLASKVDIDLSKNIISCYSQGGSLVETQIFDKGIQSASLFADYQSYNLDTGHGFGQKDVHYIAKDLDIYSEKVNMATDINNKLDHIIFTENGVSISPTERVEADELLYFPALALLKANNQARFHYISKSNDPNALLGNSKDIYVFADHLVYEKNNRLLSAFARNLTDPEKLVRVYSKDSFGRSRQMLLTLGEDNSAQTAVLTGLAYSQNKDKSLVSHEIIFDLKSNTMESNVGRPQTLIMKAAEKPAVVLDNKKRS